MAFVYEYIDGQRVEWNVAAAFRRMDAAFHARWGYRLKVRSGTRTTAEQTKIFLERYVTADRVNGRRVYDTRWWAGKRWYRISPLGTVAIPRTSNHEEEGPNGPRSLDIYDTGPDAGVTVRGTARDKWMAANAGAFGFTNEGYNFSEPWHKTFNGKIGGSPAPAGGGGSTSKPTTPTSPEEDEDMAKMKGAYYVRASDKQTVYMLFNEESGFVAEHTGVNGTYNNALAGNWETNSWPSITESHARVIKAGLAEVRPAK